MPLQYNTGPGGLMYSPDRDFAYNYPRMIQSIRENFNHDKRPELYAVVAAAMKATHEPIDSGDEPDVFKALDEANTAYSNFVNICCQDPDEAVGECLQRSGFLDVHPAAQFGWLAMMGTVMTGQLFVGLRDVTTQTASDADALLLGGDEVDKTLNKVEE